MPSQHTLQVILLWPVLGHKVPRAPCAHGMCTSVTPLCILRCTNLVHQCDTIVHMCTSVHITIITLDRSPVHHWAHTNPKYSQLRGNIVSSLPKHACFWDMGRRYSAQRRPTHVLGCCEAAALTTGAPVQLRHHQSQQGL